MTNAFWVPLNVIHVVTGVGACIRTEVQSTPAGDVQRYVPLQSGDIAWDACMCGLLTQSIDVEYPTDQFAAQTQGTRRGGCGPPVITVQVQVYLIRCVPVPDDQGHPPKVNAVVNSAVNQEYDAYALWKSINCCLSTLKRERPQRITQFEVGSLQRVGPSGACGGIQVAYRFGLGNAVGCCEDG